MNNFTVFTGSMFSGKSTILLNTIENFLRAKKIILVLNHKLDDDRYNKSSITTHTGMTTDAYSIDNVDALKEFDLKKYDAIFIDELQFFNVEVLKEILNGKRPKCKLFCSGLDLTWQNEPFDTTMYAMAKADKVTKLKAICDHCKEYKHCISFNTSTSKFDVIDVGGNDKYKPICSECYEVIKGD